MPGLAEGLYFDLLDFNDFLDSPDCLAGFLTEYLYYEPPRAETVEFLRWEELSLVSPRARALYTFQSMYTMYSLQSMYT